MFFFGGGPSVDFVFLAILEKSISADDCYLLCTMSPCRKRLVSAHSWILWNTWWFLLQVCGNGDLLFIVLYVCLCFYQGLKANMKRLYGLVTEDVFYRCKKRTKYSALLFALCFFHSVLIERRKFLMLGWNVFYGFNNSDFEVCATFRTLPILQQSS